MAEVMTVNGNEYKIIKLLGYGKGGYSYLAQRDGRQVVLKQIHHEPCAYYSFGNKIEAERHDYGRLKNAGIRIPAMIDIDEKAERIVKEYIEGETVFDLVKSGASAQPYFEQVREMAAQKACSTTSITNVTATWTSGALKTGELNTGRAQRNLKRISKTITTDERCCIK